MQWKKINIFLRAEGILQPSVSQNIKLLSAPGAGNMFNFSAKCQIRGAQVGGFLWWKETKTLDGNQ